MCILQAIAILRNIALISDDDTVQPGCTEGNRLPEIREVLLRHHAKMRQ
jgi:hypothetical protein